MRSECEDGYEIVCWRCGNEMEVVDTRPCASTVRCSFCDDEMERLENIECDYEVLMKKYGDVSGLYQSLQDHLKCLLT